MLGRLSFLIRSQRLHLNANAPHFRDNPVLQQLIKRQAGYSVRATTKAGCDIGCSACAASAGLILILLQTRGDGIRQLDPILGAHSYAVIM